MGTNLSISSGVLSATNTTYSVGDGGLTQNNFTNTLKTKLDGIATSANNYTLPTAASDTLGGVKVGTNLSISSGVLSATDTNTTYSVGDGGLTQNNFTNTLKTKLDGIATSANNYSLPTSSTSTLGGVKVDGSTITINGSGVISSSGGSSAWTTSGSDIYRSSGNVGIGTTSPETLLTVGNHPFTNGTRDLLRFPSRRHNEAFTIRNNDDASTGRLEFYWGNSQNGSGGHDSTVDASILTLVHNGRVGIGTTSPSTALHVYTIDGSENTGSRHQINYNGGASGSGGSGNLSLRVRGRSWFEDYTFHSSDSRIKKEIEDIPDKLALEQVRNIPCRYYKYVDTYGKGDSRTIGFIAQEVNSVLPMAVSIKTGIIPNVYKVIQCEWTGSVMSSQELGTVSGVKYKFYVSNTENDEVEKIVTGNDDSTFTFGQQWTNIFCYGYEVEDFHTLDKNKLFALNFSATQEIDRIQQQELTKVKDLEIENFLLKERVKDLESKMNDVLNRLDQLENN